MQERQKETLHDTRPDSCSNCKRYKKSCTFDWLSSRKAKRLQHRRRTCTTNTFPETPITGHGTSLYEGTSSSDRHHLNEIDNPLDPSTGAESCLRSSRQDELLLQTTEPSTSIEDQVGSTGEDSMSVPTQILQTPLEPTDTLDFINSPSLNDATHPLRRPEPNSISNTCLLSRHSELSKTRTYQSTYQHALLANLSDQTANEHLRSTVTQNLVRIYHDSMENALSCWLTERNCPYSQGRPDRAEWGPTWSNRICVRVCRLDNAATSIRGRSLSAAEDKAAARVLHLSIMAFASQWSQNFPKSSDIPFSSLAADERSFQERLWSDARHALETSAGVPSFRVVFANILFSLTQRPCKDDEDIGLDELLENDCAHTFLESAVRQMFSFRYKFAQTRPAARRSGAVFGNSQEASGISDTDDFSSIENRDTFDLLFWLGVMFDTQIAAMHQRPPVVSDEDSQKTIGPRPRTSALLHAGNVLDLDGFNLFAPRPRGKSQDLWGDFLLHRPSEHQKKNSPVPTWPCSHEQAAEILSDGAPVKVLLWRRVTQLQTLTYREAEPEAIEEGIHKALLVYRHWNTTYNEFILSCVSSHAKLPPRIQSWYVVLAAHWHLGAMILADVIESIDQSQFSQESQRDSRQAIDLVQTMRRDNASAVATLAQCSLREKISAKHRFHDSLSHTAFLTEPFTLLLVHSFAKSGYIMLDNLVVSSDPVYCSPARSQDYFRQGCEISIRALQCLGRKSDLASVVGRGLSRRLDMKVEPSSPEEQLLGSENFGGLSDFCWVDASGPGFDTSHFSSMNSFDEIEL
ncbi:hypothetical protein N7532_008606 [Penicillium argentinense]|uniref:Uncharacterized protein n=1 Tax=Penicillium argentinense TaxID=1131581 RepID=A0A9W9EXQ8_9EURO|nr:uncharacterized protein N7532_008606 [Penicillium argentinense]KAJ5089922.1 hypothetical protein N7532_008606 [Penicillium argentinense]